MFVEYMCALKYLHQELGAVLLNHPGFDHAVLQNVHIVTGFILADDLVTGTEIQLIDEIAHRASLIPGKDRNV